jgi:hypothetical protein
MSSPFDLSALKPELSAIFKRYPAGNHCDRCAEALGKLLVSKGYRVSILTLQNEALFGSPEVRPPFINVRNVDGGLFLLGESGFHQVCRVDMEPDDYFIDSLVHLHYPFQAVDEDTYFGLFEYPDGIEITDVRLVK